jgi:chromosomal replication initiator protein
LSAIATPPISSITLERPLTVRKYLPSLSEDWILDTYWFGAENQLLQFLFDPERLPSLNSISPVLLYGEKQLGKTALAITLALRWSKTTKLRPIVISNGESFCREFAAAIEIDDVESFRSKYRQCKMLLIDDLDSIAEKTAAQDELSATVDALMDGGVPIILTSTVLPSALKGIKSSLTSRLVAGFSMHLQRPGQATRDSLVQAFVARLDPKLDPGRLLLLLNQLPASNLSTLQIRDFVLLASQNKTASGELDARIIAALMRQHQQGRTPDITAITKLICRRLQVKLLDVRGTSREANIMRARSLAIYLTRKLTTLSLLQIGEYFAGRDHSTILHSIRKVAAQLATDSELANLCREVEAELIG